MGFILSMKGRVRDAMTAIPFGVSDSEMKKNGTAAGGKRIAHVRVVKANIVGCWISVRTKRGHRRTNRQEVVKRQEGREVM